MRSPMADDGLRSLGDTVCLRTVSMEWNVPEKHGPHGVLLFLPDSEEAGNCAEQ